LIFNSNTSEEIMVTGMIIPEVVFVQLSYEDARSEKNGIRMLIFNSNTSEETMITGTYVH